MISAGPGTGLSFHSRVAGLGPGVPDIVRNLPPLPLACHRVLELAQASDAEPGDLVDTIGSDPRMAMKTLRVANSAAVAGQREITDLHQAIMRIGFRECLQLALAVAFLSPFHSVPCWLDLDDLRRDGLRTAQRWAALDPTVGLAAVLKSAGLLAMTTDGARFDRYMHTAGCSTDYDHLHRIERELYGADRCALTASALALWGVPAELQRVATGWHLCQPDADPRFYLAAHECGRVSPSSLLQWLAVR